MEEVHLESLAPLDRLHDLLETQADLSGLKHLGESRLLLALLLLLAVRLLLLGLQQFSRRGNDLLHFLFSLGRVLLLLRCALLFSFQEFS